MKTLIAALLLCGTVQAQGIAPQPQFGIYNPYRRNYTLYYQWNMPPQQSIRQPHYVHPGPSRQLYPSLYYPMSVPRNYPSWNGR